MSFVNKTDITRKAQTKAGDKQTLKLAPNEEN